MVNKKMEEIESSSVKKTKNFAGKVLPLLKKNNLICLYGELGAGKTVFVKGLAKILGIKKPVLSPTFVLLKKYKIKKSLSAISYQSLVHLDLYRIKNGNDLKSFDLNEVLNDRKNLLVIEWPKKIEKILPKKRINIYFKHINEKKRKIKLVINN